MSEKIERANDVYGFKCDCSLCKLDAEDPMRPHREKLLEEIDSKNFNTNVSVSEALTDLQKMRCTYLKRGMYQFHLIAPIESLANKYRCNFDYKTSAKCFEDIFELIKEFNDFVSVTVLKEALTDYKKSEKTKKIEQIKKKAFEYFESIHFFKHYYEKLWLKMLKLSES